MKNARAFSKGLFQEEKAEDLMIFGLFLFLLCFFLLFLLLYFEG